MIADLNFAIMLYKDLRVEIEKKEKKKKKKKTKYADFVFVL